MIKYNLICANGHEFEVWFSKSADYDKQAPKGLVACAHCANTDVEKAIMAPNVSTSRSKEKIADQTASTQVKALAALSNVASKVREQIANNCEDVGDAFADEARAIHYGEKPERGIYGKASSKQAAELREEGIGAMPLPDTLVPKKSKLN